MLENIVSFRLPVAERMQIRRNRWQPEGTTAEEAKKLPRLCVVTGTHGDELEGQYVCWLMNRAIAAHPEYLTGIVDIYPALNPLGVDTITRGIPRFDLDMNRIFPGDARGTTEEVIAAKIVADMAGASCVVDIHASNIFLREIPQVRVNVNTAEKLVPLAKTLNCDFIWVHAAATVLESTLAWSLNSIGTPCLVAEMGVGMRITKDYGEKMLAGLLNLAKTLGIWKGPVEKVTEPIVSTDGRVGFINANAAGIFIPEIEHWMSLRKGDLLGIVTDPVTGEVLEEVRSPSNGLVFTLREYPVVNPGSLLARILDVDSEAAKKAAAKSAKAAAEKAAQKKETTDKAAEPAAPKPKRAPCRRRAKAAAPEAAEVKQAQAPEAAKAPAAPAAEAKPAKAAPKRAAKRQTVKKEA